MAAAQEQSKDVPTPRRRMATLETRFTLFVSVLLLTFGILTSVLVVDAGRRQVIQDMRERIEFYGVHAAAGLAVPVKAHDIAAIDAMTKRLGGGPNIIAVSVEDAHGVKLVGNWGAARAASKRTVENDRIPIVTHAGERVGTLVYTLASEKVASASAHGLVFALVWLGLFIVLCIPLTVAMVRNATAPLRKLTAFAEQLNAQKLTMQIDIPPGDEFETLARAFNHMVSRLNATMRRMHRIAYVDATTELPNSDRLLRDLAAAIDSAQRRGDPGALFLVSVDRAPRAAESLGEDAGRELIVAAARRLGEAAKTSDPTLACAEANRRAAPIVARMGASEFAVLYPHLPKSTDLHGLARALIGGFDQPFVWRDHRVAMPAIAGAAFFPRDGHDVDELMRHARLALNAARTDTANYRFFTKSLDRAASAKLNLEREIRSALDRNEFKAYFQPKINLRNGRVEGAEALARWVRSDGGIISPGKFIPAAEEMGLIGPISEAILRDACWKAAAWSREGLAAHVAVNVSALQFADDNFPAKVMKIAEQAGLPLRCLELEITESVAMEDVDRALRMIEPLRAAGVRFSIDDFGTGHSSLAALTRLPFGVLKIDQSFVRGLSTDRHSAAIIETILAMAAALDYEVIAEGVETEEEAEFLRRRGCPIAQGFLFSAAQPPNEYLRILREGSMQPNRVDKPTGAPGALDPAA